MAARERIGRVAAASLVVALALAVAGKLVEYGTPYAFVGGLVAAFAEAALIGGLADWFAVRALFAHPLGVPLPHTAIIPRNRKRLTAEIRKLVVNEWLPRDVLARKLEGFDFVGQGILPAVGELRPQLRELLRLALLEVLAGVEPRELAAWAARGFGAGDTGEIAPWLAELIRQAREKGWLEPVLREVVRRLERWAASQESRKFIQKRMEQAAENYRQRGGWKDLMLTIGEISGGVDFVEASGSVQAELRRFASEQMDDGSHMKTMLHDGLVNLEQRLRDDGEMRTAIRGVMEGQGTVGAVVERMLGSLRDEAREQLEKDASPWLDLAMRQADAWLARLGEDQSLRDRANDWCRKLAVGQLDKHHALIGVLVEEQMNRLSDDAMTELIQKRVGEDLNWIRLNGTFVGGLIGVGLYLLVALVRWVAS